MSGRIERMKACLNGRRDRSEHSGVPTTPGELARSAEAAVAAGAEAVHLHARDGSGAESLAAADIGAAVAAVRAVCPDTPVGVSTGLWITGGDPRARQLAVAGWAGLGVRARPDFASVNVCEPGWTELAGTLSLAGILTEAGVWSVADARALVSAPVADLARILVEITGGPAETAVDRADQILRELDDAGATAPRLLHGEREWCWPLVAQAGALGLPTRIGLEDTIVGPDGQPVTGNADLVRLALAHWTSASSIPQPD
jgi:uncharacterized protein (DUF849 family)